MGCLGVPRASLKYKQVPIFSVAPPVAAPHRSGNIIPPIPSVQHQIYIIPEHNVGFFLSQEQHLLLLVSLFKQFTQKKIAAMALRAQVRKFPLKCHYNIFLLGLVLMSEHRWFEVDDFDLVREFKWVLALSPAPYAWPWSGQFLLTDNYRVGVFATLTNSYALVATGGSMNFYRFALISYTGWIWLVDRR